MKNVRKFFAVVLAVVMVLTTVAAASASFFVDVTDETPYKAAIEQLYALNVIEGVGDNKFEPEREVTRNETVKMVYVLLEGTLADGTHKNPILYTGESVFTDVTVEDFYCGYINWAASKNIVDGIGNKLFNGNATVKFSEFVKVVYNAYLVATGSTVPTGDNAISYPYGYIATADGIGLYNGLTVRGASETVTRGEAAQMLSNLLAALVENNADYMEVFAHVETLANVEYKGAASELFVEVPTADDKDATMIMLGDDWYKCNVENNLVLGEVVTAYVTKDGIALITRKCAPTELTTNVLGLTFSSSKYYVDGTEVKLESDVAFYTQRNTGLYELSTKTWADYKDLTSDEPVKLIDNDGNGKYDLVLVGARLHNMYVKTNNVNFWENVDDSPVKISNVVAKNVNGIGDLAVAMANKTLYNLTLKAEWQKNSSDNDWNTKLVVNATPENILPNVKVEKLDNWANGQFNRVTIAGTEYIYSTGIISEAPYQTALIAKLSVAETEQDKKTVDVMLDTNGRIIAWDYYEAPRADAPAAAVETGYAFVKNIAVTETTGDWGYYTYSYTITLVRVADNREVTYTVDKTVAQALTTWFCANSEGCTEAHSHSKGIVLTTDANGKPVPAIINAFVEYTYKSDVNKITDLAARTSDGTATFSYDSKYTGMINTGSAWIKLTDITGIVYGDVKAANIKTMEQFMSLVGTKRDSITVDYNLDNGKYTILVTAFTPVVVDPTETKMFAIVTSTAVLKGGESGTYQYAFTGIFNGESKTINSVEFSNETGMQFFTGMRIAVLKNGLIESFEEVPTFTYYVASDFAGDLWKLHTVDVSAKTATAGAYTDLVNGKEVVVFNSTTSNKWLPTDVTAVEVGTRGDLKTLEWKNDAPDTKVEQGKLGLFAACEYDVDNDGQLELVIVTFKTTGNTNWIVTR